MVSPLKSLKWMSQTLIVKKFVINLSYRVTQEIKLFSNFYYGAHCAFLYVETLLMGNAQWANSVPKRKLAKI